MFSESRIGASSNTGAMSLGFFQYSFHGWTLALEDDNLKKRGFCFSILYSTLLHLPPLRFHCIGGCWVRIKDCCDFGIGSQML
jgi:hypothetical protein